MVTIPDNLECPKCKGRIALASLQADGKLSCLKCGVTLSLSASKKGPDGLPPIMAKCRLIKKLGEGGMGAVYLAQHLTLQVPVALKLLDPALIKKNPQMSERFLREARTAAKIRNPHVVSVLDCGIEAGRHYLIMEYVDGASLQQMIDARGRFAEMEALDLAMPVAEALAAAGEFGIIHRDIKPDNILIAKNGIVKLADMGLAKEIAPGRDEGSVTMANVAMGTPHYMSPEQATDARSVDQRADIYSLGVTLYYMVAGALPVTGDTPFEIIRRHVDGEYPSPREKRSDLSREMEMLILKMMARDREHRFPDAQTLLDVMRGIRGGDAVAALSPGQIEPLLAGRTDGSATVNESPDGKAVYGDGRHAPAWNKTKTYGLAGGAALVALIIAITIFSGSAPKPIAITPSPTPANAGGKTKEKTGPAPVAEREFAAKWRRVVLGVAGSFKGKPELRPGGTVRLSYTPFDRPSYLDDFDRGERGEAGVSGGALALKDDAVLRHKAFFADGVVVDWTVTEVEKSGWLALIDSGKNRIYLALEREKERLRAGFSPHQKSNRPLLVEDLPPEISPEKPLRLRLIKKDERLEVWIDHRKLTYKLPSLAPPFYLMCLTTGGNFTLGALEIEGRLDFNAPSEYKTRLTEQIAAEFGTGANLREIAERVRAMRQKHDLPPLDFSK